jgi:acyl dehydratase
MLRLQHTYTLEDQLAFAELSGDTNPLHTDPLVARRSLFGQLVVHGIHLILWALDNWSSDRQGPIQIQAIKTTFVTPVLLGEPVVCTVAAEKLGQNTLELRSRGVVATRIKLQWKSTTSVGEDRIARHTFPDQSECRQLGDEDLPGRSGTLELCLNREAAARLFPQLVRKFSEHFLASLLAASRLVGMECPGLHSIFSELELCHTDVSSSAGLSYDVQEFDPRFRLVVMRAQAPGMAGTIRAFLRPAPCRQAAYPDIQNRVDAQAFVGQRALVVGGSRGLGEVVGKLLAAGGAAVTLTFHRGEDEAQLLVREITVGGGQADCCRFDVLDLQPGPDFAPRVPPTHLYYLATPFIFSAVRGEFSAGLFERFCAYYVTGFLRTVNLFKPHGLQKVFYPSSIAVEELPPNMGEYAAAKMAGETLCAFLRKRHPDVDIYAPRLPRMATDQTASLVPVDNLDPVPIMVEHLRTFAGTLTRREPEEGHNPWPTS